MNDDSDPTDLPKEFGDYVLLRSLGRGGMGQVYLSKVKSKGLVGVDKMCVVKTLRVTNDPEYQRRFVDEARLIVLLTHRNICHVFDAGCFEGQYYLAMEHINGRELRAVQKLSEDHDLPLPADVAIFAIKEVLEALDAAHRMTHPISGEPLRVVHRDVSPQNVMLSSEGEVKLIDFGLAESSQKLERTAPRIVMGKIAYMAPEQARGDPGLDGRADQFAAGVLLYELLANERYYGALPFDDVWRTSGRGGFRPRGLDAIEPALVAVIQKATAANREDRYASCGDMRAALQKVELQRGVLAGSREVRTALQRLLEEAGQTLPSMSSPEIKALAAQVDARARAQAVERAALLAQPAAAAPSTTTSATTTAAPTMTSVTTTPPASAGRPSAIPPAAAPSTMGGVRDEHGSAPRERTRTFRVRSISSSDNPPTSIDGLAAHEKTEIGFVIEGLEPQELPPALATGDAFRPVSLVASDRSSPERSSSMTSGPMPPPISAFAGRRDLVSAETPSVPPVREPTLVVRPRGSAQAPTADLATMPDLRPVDLRSLDDARFEPVADGAPRRALPKLIAAAAGIAAVVVAIAVFRGGDDDAAAGVDAGATVVASLPVAELPRADLPIAGLPVESGGTAQAGDAGAALTVDAGTVATVVALPVDAGDVVVTVVDAGTVDARGHQPDIEPLEPGGPRHRVKQPRGPARDIPPLPAATDTIFARTRHLKEHCSDVPCLNDVLAAMKGTDLTPEAVIAVKDKQDSCFRKCLKRPRK